MSIDGADPTQQPPQVEALQNVTKFEQALFSYNSEKDDSMKVHQQQILKDTMALVQSSLADVSKAGIQKQGNLVQSDLNKYLDSGSAESFTALAQDTATLKEGLSA